MIFANFPWPWIPQNGLLHFKIHVLSGLHSLGAPPLPKCHSHSNHNMVVFTTKQEHIACIFQGHIRSLQVNTKLPSSANIFSSFISSPSESVSMAIMECSTCLYSYFSLGHTLVFLAPLPPFLVFRGIYTLLYSESHQICILLKVPDRNNQSSPETKN